MDASSVDSRGRWRTYRRLIRYVRPYWVRLFWGAVCGVLFAGSTVSFLHVMNRDVGNFFHFDATRSGVVLALIAIVVGLSVVRGVGEYLSSYLIEWVGKRVVTDLRIEAFAHLQNLSVAYFDSTKTGEVISRTINDTVLIEGAVSTIVADLARQPWIFAGAVGYLLWMDWKLALTSFVLLPLCVIPILALGKRVRRATTQGQERLAETVSVMQEAVVGVRIVKAFCMEHRELDRFAEQCRLYFGRVMRVVRARASMEPIIVVLSAIAMSFALVYVHAARMPLEQFMTFVLGLVMLYDPVRKLSRLHMDIQQSSAAADRVFEILDLRATVREKPGAASVAGPVREVRFDRVTFSYDGRTPVLRDVSFRVLAGQRVAIVGGSGSGKTTLLNLLLRFFDATDGRVLLDGTDVRDLTLRSLRGQFGLVTQETFLFDDTVAANIGYGRQEASQAEIEAAARRAHADDFIRAMPAGYDTVIGERGVRLSGGQRQRLAIARAILTNPPILILDEATNALDTESERLVQSALDEVMGGRTVVAVAHRLSTIANYDRILVFEKGCLVEQGTHGELVAAGGVYRRLYDLQFHGFGGEAAASNVP